MNNSYDVDNLRSKFGRSQDEYQKQLERQNSGETCEHCSAHFGHRGHCPLINRQSAEAASFVAGTYTEQDRIIAHGLGIIL